MCYLKYSLLLLTLNKTLGYTALMDVPPKVQPTFLLILNKMLGYTALMGVPPKVQPTFLLILNKHWVTLHSWVCHLKYSLRLLTLIIQVTKHCRLTLHSWVCHIEYNLRLLINNPTAKTTLGNKTFELDCSISSHIYCRGVILRIALLHYQCYDAYPLENCLGDVLCMIMLVGFLQGLD